MEDGNMTGDPEPWDGAPKKRGGQPLGAIAVAIVIGAVGLLVWRFPYALSDTGDRMTLVYLLLVLLLVAGGVTYRRVRFRQSLRNIAIWIGIAAALGIGYGFRNDFAGIASRLRGDLVPGLGTDRPGGEIAFRAGGNGHFRIEALVDGKPVLFLLDTGASDVVLSPRDAERIGFDASRLDFSRRYSTANGVVYAAPVALGTVEIASIRLGNVAAAVNGAPLDSSLLGMSFLDRLSGYSVENGTLVLRQAP
jgi:aspartyl protease family protein